MKIITKQDLKNIVFKSVKVMEQGNYRVFVVDNDGVIDRYYLPTHDEVKTVEVDGDITTETRIVDNPLEIAAIEQMVEEGGMITAGMLQLSTPPIDIPSFMKRPVVPVEKTRTKRSANQERTFAWWLSTFQDNEGGE